MRTARAATLVLATVLAGLTAGLFAGFAYSVMPGLRRSSDTAFVEVMQNINVVIVNPLFMTLFMGGLVAGLAAVVTNWRSDDPAVRYWAIAGFVCYVVMFGITSGANVPLNDKLAAAGDPAQIADLAAVRAQFEGPWVAWNIARAIVNVGALGGFALALLRFRRTADRAA
ncbi:anthrone oxygenase family protein [Nocardia sp. NBC_00403]|uniref:anthrone oxygenase family protein n=1 Tax=Nocardia sp. NBC_00403 TaxID=2975990 RepID=UPI002E2430DD